MKVGSPMLSWHIIHCESLSIRDVQHIIILWDTVSRRRWLPGPTKPSVAARATGPSDLPAPGATGPAAPTGPPPLPPPPPLFGPTRVRCAAVRADRGRVSGPLPPRTQSGGYYTLIIRKHKFGPSRPIQIYMVIQQKHHSL